VTILGGIGSMVGSILGILLGIVVAFSQFYVSAGVGQMIFLVSAFFFFSPAACSANPRRPDGQGNFLTGAATAQRAQNLDRALAAIVVALAPWPSQRTTTT
jgi:hypothetical protein